MNKTQQNETQLNSKSNSRGESARSGLWMELGIAILLIAVGIMLRFGSLGIPNFAPVAAIGLFAGCVLSRRTIAILIPLFILAISDLWIGGYQWLIMASVFACYAAMPLLGGMLKPWFDRERSADARPSLRSKLASRLSMLGCAAAGSVLFFVVTNFAVWLSGEQATLLQTYVAAIPFYQYTLAGDLFFSMALIATMDLTGVWSLVWRSGPAVTTQAA